ncbi:MAG TPA: ABC transporter permease, partial [Blastocatellia bacterium]|nr:ABC transporter permease [Blastocatellia bacterium]
MATAFQYVLQSWRFAKKRPLGTTLTVVILAIGMGASTAILSVVDAWLVRDLPFPNATRLVTIWRTESVKSRTPHGSPEYVSFKELLHENTVFDAVAAYSWRAYTLTGTGDPERLLAKAVTIDMFSALGVSPAIGRTFQPDDLTRTEPVMLSYALWDRRFGRSPEVLSTAILLNEKPYTVVGVMPSGFSIPSIGQPPKRFDDIWTLLDDRDPQIESHPEAAVGIVARLKPHVRLTDAEQEVGSIQERTDLAYSVGRQDPGVIVVGLQDDLARSIRPALYILLAAAALLLGIATLNAIILLLGHAHDSLRDWAVRCALGAGLRHLAYHLLTQSMLISVI